MTKLSFLAALLFISFGYARAVDSNEDVTSLDANNVITPDFSSWISSQLDGHSVGFALGTVKIGADANGTSFEYAAWGNSSDTDKVTPQTLFGIASCSKSFLAASVGILMDDFATGRNVTALPSGLSAFTWDTKMKDLLPDDWKLMDEWASEKASVRDALSHMTGLPRHDYAYFEGESVPELIQRLRFLKPAHELRQQWTYNNIMYMTASGLVARYSGMPYTSFVDTRILSPLGMNSSTFVPSEALQNGLTNSWTATGQKLPLGWNDSAIEIIAGAGGLFTNVVDLSKWAESLLHNGTNPHTGAVVVPQAQLTTITTAQAIQVGRASGELSIEGYGAGWNVFSYRGYQVISHDGGIPGFAAYLLLIPELGLGIVNMVNADGFEPFVQAAALRAVDVVLGEALPPAGSAQSQAAVRARIPVSKRQSTNSTTDLSRFAGTYSNGGYGNFTLCAPTGDTADCDSVRGDFARVANATGNFPPGWASTPDNQLVGRWPERHLLSSHIQMVPLASADNVQNTTFTLHLPVLFGLDGSGDAFAYDTSGAVSAVFDTDENGAISGFGYFNPKDGVDPGVGSIEERAYAWFARV